MAEYIEREKVYKMLHSFGGCGAEYGGCGAEPKSWADGWDKAIDTAISELGDIPAADVRPERHGHWEAAGDGDILCGKCGASYKAREIIPQCFCSCCGAKMDRKDGDNNENSKRN